MAEKEIYIPVSAPNERGEMNVVTMREDGHLESGVLSPLVEGKPIMGDFVSAQRIEGTSLLYGERTRTTTTGPAMVNSQSYRDGWDRIFGKPQDTAEA